MLAAGRDRFETSHAFTGFGAFAAMLEPREFAVLADPVRQFDDERLMRFGAFVLHVPEEPSRFDRSREPEVMVGEHDADRRIRLRSGGEERRDQTGGDRAGRTGAAHGYAIARAASRA